MDNVLYRKLAALPEHLRAEVSDFIDFLVTKADKYKNRKLNPKPRFGSGKGTFVMKKDFREPLNDFKEYMN